MNMTPQLYQRINDIVEQALDLPAAERALFLDNACGSDAALRAEAQSLLAHESQVPNSFLASPVLGQADGSAATVDEPAKGSTIDYVVPKKPTPRESQHGYQIEATLGKGAMGVVYLARDMKLGRKVALKMILAGASADEVQKRRFDAEAAAVAQIDHPNIVRIYEFGEREGQPYFALEYIDGGTLAQRMRDKPLSHQEAAQIIQLLARATQAAHERKIIHRDLKPANVLMTAAGSPKISDFGLAKRLDSDQSLSHTGDIMGTPCYMAPEQAFGQIQQIGPATDVYSLGAILYEMLTGQPPFRGENTAATLEMVRSQEPKPPCALQPKTPRDLETICLKCLRKDPKDRYTSALALAQDLERFQAGESIIARPESVFTRLRRRIRTHRAASIAAVIVLMVAVGATAAIVYRGGHLSRVENLADRLQAQLNESYSTDEKILKGQLKESYWTDEKIKDHETLLDELNTLAPDRIDKARERFHNSLLDSAMLRVKMQRSLEASERDYIERMIGVLAQRSPNDSKSLFDARKSRFGDWRSTFALTDPQKTTLGLQQFAKEPTPRELVLTKHECQGNVRLEAIWDSYDEAATLGLALHGDLDRNQTGYVFQVDALLPKLAAEQGFTKPTMGLVQKFNGSVQLQILRNGVALRKVEVSLHTLGALPLKFAVERENDRLKFFVNAMPIVEARDLVPLTTRGAYGIVWPEGTALKSLVGKRKELPSKPGKLETGDDLFAHGKFAEAQEYYARQTVELIGSADRFEARFKNALVLEQLNQKATALQEFEALANDAAADSGNKWVFLATFQLWVDRLRKKNYEEAWPLLDKLLATGIASDRDALILYIPEAARYDVLQGYHDTISGIAYWRPDKLRLKNAEAAVNIELLMGVAPAKANRTKQSLLRALRIENQQAKAIQLATKWLKDLPEDDQDGHLFVSEYAWLMREIGTPSRALEPLNRRLYKRPNEIWPDKNFMLLERARIHAATKEWELAEKDVENFLSTAEYDKVAYRSWSDAHLMLGLFKHRRGDIAGALEAWRKGKYRGNPSDPALGIKLAGAMGLVNLLMVDTLCQDFEAVRTEALLRNILREMPDLENQFAGLGANFLLKTMTPMANAMWKNEQGHAVAEQLVFQTCTFREYPQLPMRAIAIHVLREQALGKQPLTAEQLELLNGLCDAGLESVVTGKLQRKQVLDLGALWYAGPLPFLDKVEVNQVRKLEPALRGPSAYFYGLRFLQLRRTTAAEEAFRVVTESAAGNTSLRRLAQTELDKLNKK